MKKLLLLICALFAGASVYAGDVINNPGNVKVPPALAPSIERVVFELTYDDLSAGIGGGFIINSDAGWDQKEWGIGGGGEDIGKPITPELGDNNTILVGYDVKGYDYGAANYTEFVIQHWWGGTITFVSFVAYGADEEVVFSLPEGAGKPKETSVVLNFNDLDLGAYSKVEGGITAEVVEAPDRDGKAIKATCNNYDGVVFADAVLPEGVTFANVTAVKFSIHVDEADWKGQMIKFGNGTWLYKPDAYPGLAAGWNTVTIERKDFFSVDTQYGAVPAEESEVNPLTTFTIGVGINKNSGTYLVGDITIVYDVATSIKVPVVPAAPILSIDGGISVQNDGQMVEVYGIDGTLVTKTTDSNIYLEQGLYIVRVGGKATKTIVK